MKVSIIISVFNEENYINSCLKSLNNQLVKPDEIIVVDNNSTDNTINIVKKYPKVKIIKESIQGMTPARNHGFNEAKGDILIKCDADTNLPKNTIKIIRDRFIKDNIIALTTPVIFGDLIGVRKLPWIYYIYMIIPKLIIGYYPFNGPCYAIKKSIWQKVKNSVCLDDKQVHEDIDLSFHIKKFGSIYFEKDLLIFSSARRIKSQPLSFFGEYQWRFVKMLPTHWRL